MAYARFGHARRIAGASGSSSGRHIPGCHRGARRTYRLDRAAADHGPGDRQRPRRTVARDGAAQHRRVGRPHSVSSRVVRLAGRGGGGSGIRTGGWSPGRLGCEPLSAHDAGERFFVHGGWAARHAHGSVHGHDGCRSRQLHRRKDNRRSDLSARRREEGAESSQSNRPGAAHTEHTTSGRCGVAGRAQDGSFASGHEDLHGFANGRQRRTGRTGPAAPDGPRASEAAEAGWWSSASCPSTTAR